ncbi:hypothetical protein B0H16DRAFT_189962 [Mycena metata]|uniref:Uncharacterized protein n=1 Tax=Mycena metata TaxID=1033252 RepID=A0AAD7JXQ3_9AGAR|nr:hypothetical protein B0H16DRAFT_189962 [Mycena metata]
MSGRTVFSFPIATCVPPATGWAWSPLASLRTSQKCWEANRRHGARRQGCTQCQLVHFTIWQTRAYLTEWSLCCHRTIQACNSSLRAIKSVVYLSTGVFFRRRKHRSSMFSVAPWYFSPQETPFTCQSAHEQTLVYSVPLALVKSQLDSCNGWSGIKDVLQRALFL